MRTIRTHQPRAVRWAGIGWAISAVLVVLSWDAVADADKYRIYRATAPGGVYALLKTVATITTRVDVPLGATMCYKLKAVNIAGASPYSNEVCVTK